MPHLDGVPVNMRETAILISIRLCLSSLPAHKSFPQSEINSYWSALIICVEHLGGNSVSGTARLSPMVKTSFCLWNINIARWGSSANSSPCDSDRKNDGAQRGWASSHPNTMCTEAQPDREPDAHCGSPLHALQNIIT